MLNTITRTVTLNHSGNSLNNPIVGDVPTAVGDNIKFRATLNKQNSAETLKQCWIYANSKIFATLTSRCVTTDYTIYVDIISGKDTYGSSDREAALNILYFTTTNGVVISEFYVVRMPHKMITLDGYDADTSTAPLIYPVYNG